MTKTDLVAHERHQLLNGEPTDKRYFHLLLLGRSVTLIAIGILMVVMKAQLVTTAPVAPIFVFLVAMLLLTPLHYFAESRGYYKAHNISLTVIAADTTWLAVGLYLLGGQNALYGLPVYGILIAMAAVVHSPRGCFLIATLGAVSYMLMVTSSSMGFIPIRPQLFPMSLEDTFPIASITTTFALNLVMALVSSTLSQVKDTSLSNSLRLENELRHLNQNLGERVDAGRADLESKNHQLQNSVDRLELFSRAVSHDLRNPLSAASESMSMSQGSESDEERNAFLNLARENLVRADGMLMGLREVVRSSAYVPSDEPVDIRLVVEALISEFPEEARKLVRIASKAELGTTILQRHQVEHVFRNLIKNAMDHNPGESLVIRVGKGEFKGNEAFFVEDNGSGIPSDQVPYIFVPFKQGQGSTTGGLGLGLAIVQGIVSGAGEQIWCESAVGQGTTFWFSLPIGVI